MTAATPTRATSGEALPTSRKKSRLWLKALMVLLLLPVLAFLALALWPAPVDVLGDEGTAGVGAGGGGLRKPFPAMVLRADNPLPPNPATDERVELGRMLFFDPVLSGANDVSCATCHHPDLGFGDGRGLSMGKGGHGLGAERAGGAVIRRGAPSIWNSAFNHKQFWDGRAADLEEQALGPIKDEKEMAQNPETLVAELKAIPEYARRFDAVFGGSEGSGIAIDNVLKAIASFERTLISNNSPFDRYVNGDAGALTPEQVRGFNLFRSGKTRCFECHGLPTFANPDFKIIGVPDLDPQHPDLGRAEVEGGEGYRLAFKVPTLRNVALNPPYMHNGRFKDLMEVIDFYAGGGGPGKGFETPHIDDKIRPFTLSDQEKRDLIAFLSALTDESKLPAFPERVPSGLPVVGRLDNPARRSVAQHNTGSSGEKVASRPPQTIRVNAGESIQAAVSGARAGDTIEVMPGAYHEEIFIDLDNITLRGLAPDGKVAQPQTAESMNPSADTITTPAGPRARSLYWPVLNGEKKLADAVIATGSNFVIEGFEVRNYVGNGIQVQNASGPVFRDLMIDDTGLYGVYPVSCTGVTVERVTVTRIADAGIYVGQSRDILVKDSVAHGNVTGIEIENSVNAVVENNLVYDNTGGILVFVLPNNPSKVGRNCRVAGNRVFDNNHPNFGNPSSIVGRVPPGGGILIMAADETEVTGNEIRGNNSYGVAVMSLSVSFPRNTSFDVGPLPERNRIHGNIYADNGRSPAPKITEAGLAGADLLWDLSGWSNTWQERGATRATPLLSASWPSFARRAYWRALTLAQEYL